MVRTQSLAMSRPSGFALLKPASKPQLDAARIATLSGTIAVNLLAFGLLMMPMTMPPPPIDLHEEPSRDPVVRQIPPEPVIVDVAPPTVQQPVAQPVHQRISAPTQAPSNAVAVVDAGTEQDVETAATEETGPVMDIAPPSVGPAPVQLQYVSAPAPTYPRNALRAGITGTVLLQVLVGTNGRAIEVKVAQSSGNRELDEAARAQVLKRWSFRPATREGQAVQALGMVPIEFSLR